MKIFNGQANELITTRVVYGNGRKKVEHLVRFDKNGEYYIPEHDLHKFNSVMIAKLETKGFRFDFEAEKPVSEVVLLKEEENTVEDNIENVEGFECEVCGFIAKSKSGLSSHKKKHEGEV